MDTSVLSPPPPLVTLMPCGMVTPFNQAIRRFLDSAPDHIASIATNTNRWSISWFHRNWATYLPAEVFHFAIRPVTPNYLHQNCSGSVGTT